MVTLSRSQLSDIVVAGGPRVVANGADRTIPKKTALLIKNAKVRRIGRPGSPRMDRRTVAQSLLLMITNTAASGGRVLQRSNIISQAEEEEATVLYGSAVWPEEEGE